MKSALIAAAAAALVSTGAQAAAPASAAAPSAARLGAVFGNTVLTIDPDGRSRKLWLTPDGAWTGKSRRGLDLAGTWTLKGDAVCLKQSKPRLPGHMCERFPTKAGESVQVKDPSGKTVQIKLVKGRVGR